jgi:hypothetical protein
LRWASYKIYRPWSCYVIHYFSHVGFQVGVFIYSNLLDEVSEVRYSKPFSNNKRFKISMVMGSEAHERVKCPFVWDYTIDKKKILRAV